MNDDNVFANIFADIKYLCVWVRLGYLIIFNNY